MGRIWTRVGMILVGAWLLFAGVTFHFDPAQSPNQQTNTWLSGAFALVIGLISLAAPRARLFNTAVGLWLVISAFALRTSGENLWNNLICGLLLVAFSLAREPDVRAGVFSHHRRVDV